MEIKKILENIQVSSNGEYYKDIHAFCKDRDAVCYIPECVLDKLKNLHDNGEKEITNEKLIRLGASSRNNIKEEILQELSFVTDFTQEEKEKFCTDCEEELIFDELDWQCSQSLIYHYDIEEDLIEFYND